MNVVGVKVVGNIKDTLDYLEKRGAVRPVKQKVAKRQEEKLKPEIKKVSRRYSGLWGVTPYERYKFTQTERIVVREKLVNSQRQRCKFCNRRMGGVKAEPYPEMQTIEHIYHSFDIRRSIAQNNKLVACCYECNQKREEAFAKFFFQDYDGKEFFRAVDIKKELFKTLDKSREFWDYREKCYAFNGGRVQAVSEYGKKIAKYFPKPAKKKKIIPTGQPLFDINDYSLIPYTLLKIAAVWGFILYFLIN